MTRKVLIFTLIMLFALSLTSLASWEDFKPFIHNDSGTQRMPWYDEATSTLYYADDYDIVQSEWTGDAWTDPQPVPGPINTPENELSPVVRGNHLYFARYTSSSNYDFYMATWNPEKKQWDNVQSLDKLNSSDQEWKIWVSTDENVAYLASNGVYGGMKVSGDRGVWKAVKKDGQWQLPVPLEGKINSGSSEWSVFVDEANNIFYVDSNRSGGQGGYDIWVTVGEDGEAKNSAWPLSSTGNDRSLWTNGQIMFLTASGRPGGAGGYDIWIAKSSNSVSDIDLEKSAKKEASFSVTYGGKVGVKVLVTPENLVETYTELDLNTEILASNMFKAYVELETLDSGWISIRDASNAEKFNLDEFYIEAQGPFYSGGKSATLRAGNKISIDYHDYIINGSSKPGVHLSNLNIGAVDFDAVYMYRTSGVDPQFGLLYGAEANTKIENAEFIGYYLGRINHEVIESENGEKSYVFPSRYAQHSFGLEGKYSMEKGNINGLFIYQSTADRDITGELKEDVRFDHIAKIDFFYTLTDNLDLEVGLREFTKGYEYPYVDEDDSDIEDYMGQTGGHVKLATVFKEVIKGSDLNIDTDLDYYTLDEKGTATLTLNGKTSIYDVDLNGKVEVEKSEDADEVYIYGFTLAHNFELYTNQYVSLVCNLEQNTGEEELTGNIKLDTKLNRGLFRGAELWAEAQATKIENWENIFILGAKYEMPNGLTYILQYSTPNDPTDDEDNFFELSASYEF
ncbi:MAG: hypothetical protein KAX49_04485 [Halanaerobiales bacterium]|nr:hypothetical protein [Halanaerobiales bacterium]